MGIDEIFFPVITQIGGLAPRPADTLVVTRWAIVDGPCPQYVREKEWFRSRWVGCSQLYIPSTSAQPDRLPVWLGSSRL